MSPDSVIDSAQKLLRPLWGNHLRLEIRDTLDSQNIVLRCEVRDAEHAPETVILKQVALDTEWMTQRFFTEWAALAFLSTLGESPRLYAAERGLFILEDLGTHPTVHDLMSQDDLAAAVHALIAFARQLGRIQAESVGREAEFNTIVEQVGAVPPNCDTSTDARLHLHRVRECFAALDITPHPDFETELNTVEEGIHNSSDFRMLCHCDAGLHNMIVTEGCEVLLDWEFARYKNGFADLAGARMHFPQSYHGRAVPSDILYQMEAAYRAELFRVFPLIDDDALFYRMLTEGCAHWALSYLLAVQKVFLDESADDEKVVYMRWRFINHFRAFITTADEFDHLPAMRETFTRLVAALENRFGTLDPMRYYPVVDVKCCYSMS